MDTKLTKKSLAGHYLASLYHSGTEYLILYSDDNNIYLFDLVNDGRCLKVSMEDFNCYYFAFYKTSEEFFND